MMKSQTEKIIFLFLLLIPSPAFAEIIDKLPTPRFIWSWTFFWCFAGGLASRFSRWSFFISLPIPLWFLYGLHSDYYYCPVLGPAMQEEVGLAYLHQVYAAIALLMFVHLVGFIWRPEKESPADEEGAGMDEAD